MLIPPLFAAQPEDAAELAALQLGSFERPWSAANIARVLSSPGGYAIAVGRRAALDGFALARAVADEAELLILVVRRNARRGGLGEALTRAALDEAAARGAGRLLLEVSTTNWAAQSLYRRIGFREVGVRRGYYIRADGARSDALVLQLDL